MVFSFDDNTTGKQELLDMADLVSSWTVKPPQSDKEWRQRVDFVESLMDWDDDLEEGDDSNGDVPLADMIRDLLRSYDTKRLETLSASRIYVLWAEQRYVLYRLRREIRELGTTTDGDVEQQVNKILLYLKVTSIAKDPCYLPLDGGDCEETVFALCRLKERSQVVGHDTHKNGKIVPTWKVRCGNIEKWGCDAVSEIIPNDVMNYYPAKSEIVGRLEEALYADESSLYQHDFADKMKRRFLYEGIVNFGFH